MFFPIHFTLHLSFLSLPHFRLLVKMERKLNVGILSLRQIWKSCRFLSSFSFSLFLCHGYLPSFNFQGANTHHLYFFCWRLVSHCYCGKSSGGSFLPKPYEGFLSGRKVGSSVFICQLFSFDKKISVYIEFCEMSFGSVKTIRTCPPQTSNSVVSAASRPGKLDLFFGNKVCFPLAYYFSNVT